MVDFVCLYCVAAWDCDDDRISMCTVIVCLVKYYLNNMLNLTNIEGNHYTYYTSCYPLSTNCNP